MKKFRLGIDIGFQNGNLDNQDNELGNAINS